MEIQKVPPLLSTLDEECWARICKDMAGGLHQYDYWWEVPLVVQTRYRQLITSEWLDANPV